MAFCTQCGQRLAEDAAFCSACGSPKHTFSEVPMAAQPTISSETVIAIVPNLLKSKSLVLKDTFYLLGTDTRAIFIKITNELMQKAVELNKTRLAEKGSGFWGKWKNQVMGPNIYTQYLRTISPQKALSESAENFSIENNQIVRVKCSYYYQEDDPSEWHLEFQTTNSSHKFITTDNPEQLLKDTFGARVTK